MAVCLTLLDTRATGCKNQQLRPLGRPRCGWVDNIRMDLGEVGWGDVDWIDLAQDRNAVMNGSHKMP
jgi:hypothetical protein